MGADVNHKTSLGQHIAHAIGLAAQVNSAVETEPVAVLWPDKDSLWQAAMPHLRTLIPGLCSLVEYQPESRCGPAIWLKCFVAGSLAEPKPVGIPVIYLPGVSRTELRAIESCPRDLQPLAELQYRGVFWSQENSKDGTIRAFLSAENIGLNLDVAQDKATMQALSQVLEAGELLQRPLTEFTGRQINAE